VWKKYKGYVFSFIIGAILSFIILWAINNKSTELLKSELRASRWSLESAIRTNTELTTGIQQLSIKLEESNTIISEQQSILVRQQSIINNQQSIIDKQKSIIDAIIVQIDGAGDDIGKQIQIIADGFARLFSFYNKSSK
jgi:hypothetical protein